MVAPPPEPDSTSSNPDPMPATAASRRVRLATRVAVWAALLGVLGGVPLGSILHQRFRAERILAHESRLAAAEVEVINERRLIHDEAKVPVGATITQFFGDQGLDARTAEEIVRAARPAYNLAQIRAGNRLDIVRSGNGALRAVSYEVDRDRILWVSKQEEGFRAEVRPIPYEIEVAGVAGTVRDSLFQAVSDAGEGDWLTLEIADVFGWDVDFSTDTQTGDTFEVVVEKKMLNGERWGYGRVLAAQYTNEGRLHQAVLFRAPSGKPAYYAPNGKSLQKAFLRSPLKFGAPVTSGFSNRRFHPILKRYRPHHGVDYGVPVGSAVQAVGDGRVVSAGWNGGSGKMVHVRHPMGYETYYLHLSRILVRRGQQVAQGQIIARSGSTGLATGPHLDFRVTRHGQFLNFLRLKLPPREAVAAKDMAAFAATRTELLDRLANLHSESAGKVEQARAQAAEPNPTNQ